MGNILPSHGSSLGSERELTEDANHHRKAARNYFESRKDAAARSQNAYTIGDHDGAKIWSTKSKEYGRMMEQENLKAAEVIFKANNAARGLGLDQIDLHGLFVKEAEVRVEDRIRVCKKEKLKQLVVIVGKGNHSVDGIAKLRPAIANLVEKHSLRCTMGVPNEGCLLVEFVDERSKGIFGWIEDVCTIM